MDHRQMMESKRGVGTNAGLRSLLDPGRPWVWLVYLPFYAVPWLFYAPSRFDLLASAAGLAVFLVLYLAAARARNNLDVFALAILVVSLLLAPTGGQWGVLSIYAAAMSGGVRPARRALLLIAIVCAAITTTGLLLQQPLLWWGPAVLLALMIGGSTVSNAALKDKNAELLAAQEEVRALSCLAERERIGRDLHDLIGRALTLIAVKAELAERLIGRDDEAAQVEAREIAAAAREGLSDVRQALAGMRETALLRETEAARSMLETAGVRCTLDGDAGLVSPHQGAVLAMALREAVTNVVRHAEAGECRIAIRRTGQSLRVEVVDDGRGGTFREGSGLAGMRARLRAAGGALELVRVPRGTRLVASVPAQ